MPTQIDKFIKRYKNGTDLIVNENFTSEKSAEDIEEAFFEELNEINLTKNERLLKLITNGATIQELKQGLGLNNRQLALKLSSLKNKGYLIEKTFSDRIGTKVFLQQNLDINSKVNNYIELYTDGDRIRFIVIADTHFGNVNDRFDLVENVYEYAIKNYIHSIIHLGDLIDGYSPNIDNTNELKMVDARRTAKYVSKYYPRDNSIVNYILLGNHDFRTIVSSGFDITTLISKARLDMEVLGYNNATIGLNEDVIGLQHPTTLLNNFMFDNEFSKYYENRELKPSICLRGHTHESLFYLFNNTPVICAPSLYDNQARKPVGAWDITLYFNPQGKIEIIELQPLVVEPKVAPITRILHKMR